MTATGRPAQPRLIAILFLSGALALAATVAVAAGPLRAADVTILVEDFAFNPATITIQVGDTVTWTNNGDVPHTATSMSGPDSFDVSLPVGASGAVTFDTPGTYDYICSLHPIMEGTIVVEAAAASPSPTSASAEPTTAASAEPTTAASPSVPDTAAAASSTANLPLIVWLGLLSTAVMGATLLLLAWRPSRR
jgi:plastocyanin